MKSSIYKQEFNMGDAKTKILFPMMEGFKRHGANQCDLFVCQDKINDTFFIVASHDEDNYALEAITLTKGNNKLIPMHIGFCYAEKSCFYNKFGSPEDCLYVSGIEVFNKKLHFGTHLLEALRQIAENERIPYLHLTSLPESRDFYVRLGFENYCDQNGVKSDMEFIHSTDDVIYVHHKHVEVENEK